jgi:hypothetical protein
MFNIAKHRLILLNMAFILKTYFRLQTSVCKRTILFVILLLVVSSILFLSILEEKNEKYLKQGFTENHKFSEKRRNQFNFWNNIEACRQKQVHILLEVIFTDKYTASEFSLVTVDHMQ